MKIDVKMPGTESSNILFHEKSGNLGFTIEGSTQIAVLSIEQAQVILPGCLFKTVENQKGDWETLPKGTVITITI